MQRLNQILLESGAVLAAGILIVGSLLYIFSLNGV